MESSNFDTSSIRDEWYCWKSRSTSKRRYFSSIATIKIGCHCYLRHVQGLLADVKTPYERRCGQPFKGPNFSMWCNGRITSDFSERSTRNSSICQESIAWNLSWLWADRGGEFWKGDNVADIEELENMDASEIHHRRLNAHEVLTPPDGIMWLGWTMVGWFYGMLLLSARWPRPPGRREISNWTKIWRILPGHALIAGWFGKGDIMIADIEELEKVGCIRNLSSKKIIATEVLMRQKWWWFHITSTRWYSTIVRERLRIPRTPLLEPETTVRSEDDLSGEIQGESAGVSTGKTNRWRWTPCRLLVDPRWLHLSSSHWTSSSNSTCRREETFPFPLKYMDVTRSVHTDLDVMQEKRIDDYWHVDSSKLCQSLGEDSQNSLHWKKSPPEGYMWSGRRPTKIQATPRPEKVWLEAWTKIGKAAQNREMQEWAKEKQSSTMLGDWEGFTLSILTTKNTKKFTNMRGDKLERHMVPAVPCTGQPSIAKANAKPKIGNEKWVKKQESFWIYETTSRFFQSKNHEDHIAGKGFTSMTRYNLVHKFIPMPQAMEIPDARAGMEEARDNSSMDLEKVRSKKELFMKHKETKIKSTLLHWWTHARLENAELETNCRGTKAESCSGETL